MKSDHPLVLTSSSGDGTEAAHSSCGYYSITNTIRLITEFIVVLIRLNGSEMFPGLSCSSEYTPEQRTHFMIGLDRMGVGHILSALMLAFTGLGMDVQKFEQYY